MVDDEVDEGTRVYNIGKLSMQEAITCGVAIAVRRIILTILWRMYYRYLCLDLCTNIADEF